MQISSEKSNPLNPNCFLITSLIILLESVTALSLSSFINLIIVNNYYKKNKTVKILLINLIELFFLKRYLITNTKISLINFYQKFIKKIYDTEKFNLDDESLFLEFKSKLL